MQNIINGPKTTELNWVNGIRDGEPFKGHTYGISNGAGGGHKAMADAIRFKFSQSAEDGNQFQQADILRSTFLPTFVASKVERAWDDAKRAGDVAKQEALVRGKFLGLIPYNVLADYIFFIPIFIKTFITLLRDRKITQIIDTQPIGTGAVIKAARLANFLFNTHVRVLKVMTDLPKEAIHFAPGLSQADRSIYTLLATPPFKPKEGESENDYNSRVNDWWKEHFGLDPGQVEYIKPPLRPAFEQIASQPVPQELGVKINSDEELALLKSISVFKEEDIPKEEKTNVLGPNGIPVEETYRRLSYTVNPEDTVGLITIGSQANVEATKAYVNDLIDMVNQSNTLIKEGEERRKFHLFVASGRHIPNENTLFKQLIDMIDVKQIEGTFPDNLSIIPMGFQSDKEMAPAMKRADFGIYGAGGITSFEVNEVAEGQIFIHSDAKGAKVEMSEEELTQELLKGLALWERGNAESQVETHEGRAALVSPHDIFRKRLDQVIFAP